MKLIFVAFFQIKLLNNNYIQLLLETSYDSKSRTLENNANQLLIFSTQEHITFNFPYL